MPESCAAHPTRRVATATDRAPTPNGCPRRAGHSPAVRPQAYIGAPAGLPTRMPAEAIGPWPRLGLRWCNPRMEVSELVEDLMAHIPMPPSGTRSWLPEACLNYQPGAIDAFANVSAVRATADTVARLSADAARFFGRLGREHFLWFLGPRSTPGDVLESLTAPGAVAVGQGAGMRLDHEPPAQRRRALAHRPRGRRPVRRGDVARSAWPGPVSRSRAPRWAAAERLQAGPLAVQASVMSRPILAAIGFEQLVELTILRQPTTS